MINTAITYLTLTVLGIAIIAPSICGLIAVYRIRPSQLETKLNVYRLEYRDRRFGGTNLEMLVGDSEQTGLFSSLFDEAWHQEIKDPVLKSECENLYNVYMHYKSLQAKLKIFRIVFVFISMFILLATGHLSWAA